MSITDQITRIQTAKSAIKTSIENKGVTVAEDTKLDAYPALIDSIEAGSGGGGESTEHVNPDYFMARTNDNTCYRYAFYMVDDFKTIDVENLDTSKVTYMSNCFDSCVYAFDKKKIWDFSNWNTSVAENNFYMFYNAGPSRGEKITGSELRINGWTWNTTGSIGSMFDSCRFEKICFTNINFVKTPYTTDDLFQTASAKEIDVTGTDFSKFTYFTSWFKNAYNLERIIGDIDMSSANPSSIWTSESYGMFYNCKKLTSVHLKNIYKNTAMTNHVKFCIRLNTTALTDECLIEIINELPDLINDKGLTETDEIYLYLPKTNTLTEAQVKVATDKGWNVANTTY